MIQTIEAPAFLQSPIDGTLKRSGVVPWVEDKGEVGASRRRRRFTRTLKKFTFSIAVGLDELDALEDFYDTRLLGGTRQFNWKDCQRGKDYIVRFDQYPATRNVSGGRHQVEINLSET